MLSVGALPAAVSASPTEAYDGASAALEAAAKKSDRKDDQAGCACHSCDDASG
jgi:GTP cyclohydrolase III